LIESTHHATAKGGILMTVRLSRLVAILTVALTLPATAAEAAGSRAGATRAAQRHVIAYVERYGITLRTADLDLQCSAIRRSRWMCFVYANGGQCTGTLTEVYSTRTGRYRARSVDVGCGE
jgi:hypothetical protein